jgi:hypothetical protein
MLEVRRAPAGAEGKFFFVDIIGVSHYNSCNESTSY